MEPIIRSGEVRCGYWTVHYEKFPVLVALTPTNKLTSDNLNPDNKMMMIVTHHMSRAEDYLTDGKSLYKLINLDGNSTFVSAFSNTKDYKPSVNIYAVEKCQNRVIGRTLLRL